MINDTVITILLITEKATVTGITTQIKLDIRFLLPIVEVKFVIVCSSVRLANIPSGSM